MDLKRSSSITGLGDGPDAKRGTNLKEDELRIDQDLGSGTDKDSCDAQPECNMPQNVAEQPDCNGNKVHRDGSLSPSNHVAPYTGNGCAPSLESFMFRQTPAGSKLCSWMSNTDSKTSANEDNNGTALFESDIDSKTNSQNVRLNRKAIANLRRQSALRALELERELTTQSQYAPTLLIRFPDPQISVASVSGFSGSIRDVVFPINVAQRYCLVHLKVGANVERTIEEINKVRFGQGYLHAEVKTFTEEEQADCIDPCSLYVSNIPFNMNAAEIKAFVNSMRVDIGVMKRQKRARYAFVRYSNAETAKEAFRDLVSRTLNNRVLTVRYRRLRKRQGNPTPAPIDAISSLTIDTIATDDDNIECCVISPPPVESITIIDSDEEQHCGTRLNSSLVLKKRESTMTAQEKEIQRLKLQVAEHGAIIRSLQKRENNIVNTITKVEPQSDLATHKSSYMHRSLSPCSSYDIKMENDYLGITESTPEPEPDSLPDAHSNSPYGPTTCPIDGMEDPIKPSDCFGWLFSGLGRRKSAKSNARQQINETTIKKFPRSANLQVVHVQVGANLDVED
ncbi:protein painting of fourth isoform X2 [Drosophila grimshawi]|uniref:protein painting of fourth isoform X2 n=1 Tax=Drosophila grimshawi TaxID=7222 RepID=UPI000C87022C|nr:protein painting of fourth isoform X2 [Drosophila grimshawi]